MRRVATVVGLAVAVMVFSGPAWAQQRNRGRGFGLFGGGAGGIFLASNEAVQKELKLSVEQKKSLETLVAEQREAFQSSQEASPEERREQFRKAGEKARTKVKEILNSDQQKRLEQIRLQQAGLLAVAEPEVAKQLNLTSDQQKQVTEIVEKGREQFRQSFQGGQGDREERAQRMTKLREEQNEKLSAVLTAEQKEQWKKMLGEKFDVSQLRRGGGPRPRNDA